MTTESSPLSAEVVQLIEREKARGQGLSLDLETKEKVAALRQKVRAAPFRVEATWDAFVKMSEAKRQAADPSKGKHEEIVVGSFALVYSIHAFACGTRYHCASFWVPDKITPSMAAVAAWMIEALEVPDDSHLEQRREERRTTMMIYTWLELSS